MQKRDSGVGPERVHKRFLGPLPFSSKRFNPNSSRAALALPILEKGKRPTIFHFGHRDEHSAAGKKRHEFDEHEWILLSGMGNSFAFSDLAD